MKSLFPKIIFFILMLVPLFALLQPGFPVTHDGQDHVARIANFYQNLQEGNLVPRWAGNLNWGYGHPVLMFLYPLPSYLASLFHFIGFSFIDSTKLVFAVAFIFSIVSMYLWLRTFLADKAAILGALLYGYAPYHFVDLYVRGAIGELVAFIFPPLVLYFLFKLSKKSNYWYVLGGAMSLTGFILAHNAVSLMFLPVLLFYAVYLGVYIKEKKLFIRDVLCILSFGFALSAFFWLPAFVEGKYTLRDIVTQKEYKDRFVSLTQLIYGSWNYGQSGEFTVQVGLLHWLFALTGIPSLILFYRTKQKQFLLLAGFLLLFFVSLFLMTPLAKPLWDHITLLQKFQFPWRFLFLTMFSSAVIGALVFALLPKKWQLVGLIICTLFLLVTTKDMWQPKGYLQKPEQFYTNIYNGTTDTGESAPIWSVRFMEQRPKSQIELIGGQASIQEGRRTITIHEYSIKSSSETAQLRENTLYFPGWTVLVDGREVPIEFQDMNSRGVMTFRVDKGEHTVAVVFGETKLRLLADSISISSLFMLMMLGILKKRIWQN